MSYRNSNSITVQTEVEVWMDDITENVDFDDMVAAYEPDSQDLLKHVDFEDCVKHVVEDARFNCTETIDAIMEDDEIRNQLIEKLGEQAPPEVKITAGALFTAVTVGLISAVIVGTKVRFKHAEHDEVHEFTCADAGLALNMLQALAMVQS